MGRIFSPLSLCKNLKTDLAPAGEVSPYCSATSRCANHPQERDSCCHAVLPTPNDWFWLTWGNLSFQMGVFVSCLTENPVQVMKNGLGLFKINSWNQTEWIKENKVLSKWELLLCQSVFQVTQLCSSICIVL